MLTIRVLLFGHFRDYAPADSGGTLTVSLPDDGDATPAALAAQLAARDPRFADLLARTRIAVRAEFAAPDTLLHEGDEVAFLPPMSGG